MKIYNFFIQNLKKRNIISCSLLLFSFFYWIISKIIFFFQKKEQLIVNRSKVICIGNIVAGGAGKTQFIITLIEIIKKYTSDISICVISKGYGRKNNEEYFIKKSSTYYKPQEIGDEPFILKEYSDVFVVNKRNKLPIDIYKYDIVILDDGFQDYTIFKDINIIIFDANFFIGNGFILPAGPLRMNLSNIKNADLIILNNFNEKNDQHIKKINLLKRYKKDDNIFISKNIIVSEHDKTQNYIAFSGLGDNDKFLNLLKENDFKINEFISFPDHYSYSQHDINMLYNKIFNIPGKGITTKKDIVKIANINYKFDKFSQEKIVSLLKEQDFLECLEIETKIQNIDLFNDKLKKLILKTFNYQT